MVLKWLKKRVLPWFRLKTDDGDVIAGKQLQDKSLELHIDSGWYETSLRLTAEEAEKLIIWLVRTYRGNLNARPAAVLSIHSPKADPKGNPPASE